MEETLWIPEAQCVPSIQTVEELADTMWECVCLNPLAASGFRAYASAMMTRGERMRVPPPLKALVEASGLPHCDRGAALAATEHGGCQSSEAGGQTSVDEGNNTEDCRTKGEAEEGTPSVAVRPIEKEPRSALARLVAAAQKSVKPLSDQRLGGTVGGAMEEEEEEEEEAISRKRKRSSFFSDQLKETMNEAKRRDDESPACDKTPTTLPVTAKNSSQMTREEFRSQYKRAPRRGEIGQSAEEIQAAESLGYVMSGSRSKAAQMFANRVQQQLLERDAAKRDQQFRQVEDERNNIQIVSALQDFIHQKVTGMRD